MFEELLKEAEAGKPKAAAKLIDHVMRTCPARMPEVVRFAQGPEIGPIAITGVKARLKEAASGVGSRGLDKVFEELEETLVGVWALEERGALRGEAVNEIVATFLSYLKKIAPPPIKKRKHTDPPIKHPPLAETSVRRGLDILLLLHGLYQVGDFHQQTDKARHAHELFLDDWRRRIFDSARLSWDQFRALVGSEERVTERRFSRASAMELVASIDKRRYDNVTVLPDVSMIACERCGTFKGEIRVRCSVCSALFCTKCCAREGELCLADYAARYAGVDPAIRAQIAAAAREVSAKYRLSEYARNDAFRRALDQEGVELVFVESAPENGEETEASQGRRKLTMRDRENANAKRILFAALGRSWARAQAREFPADHEALFVDVSLAVPIEDALAWRGSRSSGSRS